MSNYTILHLHSMLSNGTTNIDSVTKFEDYITKAKELGMKAIAITEHGNIFSWKKKMDCCNENKLKYIHAVEAYVTEDLNNKTRDNYHCCLYSRNTEGFHELNKLMSNASNRNDGHFYFTPRISFQELINTSDNIIIATACLGGILAKNRAVLKDTFLNFIIKNKHRCFLELQHHNVKEQLDYNEYLYELHREYNIPLTIGTDTHALNKEHLEGRTILQKAKGIHFENEEGWDLSLKTYDEIIKLYENHTYIPTEKIKEALENTNVIADMIDKYEIDLTEKYPKLYDNSEGVFKKKILDGIYTRNLKDKINFDEYVSRVNEEFKVYKKLNAIDYMLLETKILEDAKANGIEYGYGRGSVNGSIIAYLLGITECDSVKHKLNFFRFLNPDRASMADIDVDFCKKDRDWVKEYLFRMEGVYCADIITFNTIADKGAIRDVGRALQIPLDEVSRICNDFDVKEARLRKEFPELFKYVDIVKGTVVSIGTHPSGTIVSPIPLDTSMGLCSLSTTNNPVSMLQMKEIDSLNFVKLDILGLDNIGVINETCKLVGIERLTPDNVDFNDDNVFESLREDTTTVFQMESQMAYDYLKHILSKEVFDKIKQRYPEITKFDLLKFTNGAIRPSGESFREKAMNGICGENGLQEIDDMFYDSLGYCLVQEQIMMFLVKFCGFSMVESDLVRRAIAKKGGTEQYIEDIKMRFIDYTHKHYNIPNDKAKEIIEPFIDVIISAQRYGFSDNHNFPYSTTSYVCAYLRHYYPLEYLTSCLNMWSDDNDKTTRISQYSNKLGIEILSPKYGYARAKYFMSKETNSIYKGIGSIKNLNDKVGEELYKLSQNTKHKDFLSLLEDINKNTSINLRQLEILVKIGFFSEFGGSAYQLNVIDIYYKLNEKKQFSKTKLPFSEDIIRSYSEKETEKTFREIDSYGLIKELVSRLDERQMVAIEDIIKTQLECFGYVSYTDSTYDGRYMIITDVKINKYGTPFVSLYRVTDGEEKQIKVDKKYFSQKLLNVCDMIYIAEIEEKHKKKKIDNKWVLSEEKEYILTRYRRITNAD